MSVGNILLIIYSELGNECSEELYLHSLPNSF